MKRQFILRQILFFILCFIFYNSVLAQGIYFYKIYADNFPNMRVNYTARNGQGDSLAVPWSEYHLWENGNSMDATLTVDCSKKDIPGVSILLLLDDSNSMYDLIFPNKGENKFDWLKKLMHIFIDSLKFVNGTQCAVYFFANGNKIPTRPGAGGWKTSPEKLHEALDYEMNFIGATDYYKAFYGPSYNIFDVMNSVTDTMPRHIVFVSDMTPDQILTYAQEDTIIAHARRARTFIHSVSLFSDVYYQMEDINMATYGKQVKAVNPKDTSYMKKAVGNLAKFIQWPYLCELRWKTSYSCDESGRDRVVDIKRIIPKTPKPDTPVVWTKPYIAPSYSVNSITLSKDNFLMGPPESLQKERDITISHIGDEFTFTGIKFTPDNQLVVKNWGGGSPPFQFKNGDSRTIKVGYPATPPTVSSKVNMSFQIKDYPCTIPQVELVTLCSGTAVSVLKFDSVEKSTDKSINIDCALKNKTAIAIEVTASIKGDHPNDFKIFGETTKLIEPGQCMKFDVQFKPTDAGERRAYIEYSLPADCGVTYRTDLNGFGYISSVEEKYSGSAVTNSLRVDLEPNPAREEVKINFEILKSGSTSIALYNSVGTLVDVLLDKELTAGVWEGIYNVSHLASGIYFMRISSGEAFSMERLIVAK